MIEFSNTPPDDGTGPALPLRRTPTGKPVQAVATSLDLIGCMTHFFKGRTQPHQNENCEACNAGLPKRWHTYLAASECGTLQHFIFETTKRGTEPFLDYRARYGTIRGCQFKASRANTAANSRVIIITKRIDLETVNLPAPPDLAACMSIIWNVAKPDVAGDPVTNAAIERIVKRNGQQIHLHVSEVS